MVVALGPCYACYISLHIVQIYNYKVCYFLLLLPSSPSGGVAGGGGWICGVEKGGGGKGLVRVCLFRSKCRHVATNKY